LITNSAILPGFIAALFLFAGCCGSFEEGGECVGETVITINEETKVCDDGVMTGVCDTEGEIYKQDEDERTICKGGKWVKEDITTTQPSTTQPSTPPNNTVEIPSESEEDESCIGTGFVTANEVTKACVNGEWTTDCTNEGEIYDESDFLEVKIVCEGGHWVSKPL
jgi:hypothetical protein